MAKSDSLTEQLLADVAVDLRISDPGPLVAVRLQEHIPGTGLHGRRGTGYTDVEIVAERAHVIIEAKRGWDLPSVEQLTKYAESLRPNRPGGLLITAEGCPEFARGRYPVTVDARDTAVPVAYRAWAELTALSLREPGRNRLRDLHVQLDRAVMQAYGFTPQDDLLAQLLALNESIADEAETGTTMAPGPRGHGFANTQRTTSLLESSLELSSA